MNIDSWLTDSFSWSARTGVDGNATPTYAAPVSLFGRIESKFNLMFGVPTTTVKFNHVIATTTLINVDDIVWLTNPPYSDNSASIDSGRIVMSTNYAATKDTTFSLYLVYL